MVISLIPQFVQRTNGKLVNFLVCSGGLAVKQKCVKLGSASRQVDHKCMYRFACVHSPTQDNIIWVLNPLAFAPPQIAQFSFSLSLPLSLSACLCLSVCLSVSVSLSLSLTLSHSFSLPPSLSLSLCLSRSLSLSLSLSVSLSLSLSLSVKNTKQFWKIFST